jgi:cytochrome P450
MDVQESQCMRDRFNEAAIIQEPMEYLAQLREEAPVFYSETLRAYIVTRFADVQEAASWNEVFSSSPSADGSMFLNFAPEYTPLYTAAGVPPQKPTLVVTDGAAHKRYRSLVERAFTMSSVKKLGRPVAELTDSLIDQFIDRGAADLYKEFCLKLPLFVICDMLGLPRAEAELLKRAADTAPRLLGGALETPETVVALHQEQVEFHKYLMGQIAQRRATPNDTLISQLIHTLPEDGVPLSDEELLSIITTLNVGGNETTTNGLGNMFMLCFSQEGMQERLRADRELVPAFVEEALRVEAPVATMVRFTTRDTVLGGVAIPAGSTVMISFQGGNRDERQFSCPAEIQLDRKGIRNHLAFGAGVHYCLGAMLARLELKVALNRILDRMTDIKIANQGCPLTHEPKLIVRALTALPVTFTKVW